MKSLFLFITVYFTFQPLIIANGLGGDPLNGKGTIVTSSGVHYTGNFKAGRFDGIGKAVYRDGDEYIGEWLNGLKEGKGKYSFADGSIYRGHFHKDLIEGKGTMIYDNGEQYKGEWLAGKPNGQGAYIFTDNDRYEGSIKNGILQGLGTMYYADGTKYTGQWLNGDRNGNGSFTDVDGKIITGTWLNGELKKELATTSNNRVQNTSPNVTLNNSSPVRPSSTESIRDCNSSYCKNGKGSYTYADGSKYIGDFKDGEPLGYGTCTYANGDRYEGFWANDSPNGKGLLIDHNGKRIMAIWDNGTTQKMVEEEVVVDPDNLKVEYSPEVKIWATIVGVSKYTYMPSLNYTDDDAYRMDAFLQSNKGGALEDDQIQLLVDEQATRKGILTAVQKSFAKADANDVVIFYFSGHGLDGSIIPIDFNGYQNKILYQEIADIIKKSRAKQKIIITDACYSGSMMASRSPYNSQIAGFYDALADAGEGTVIITSSKQQEYSMEDMGLRSGVFSYYLIKGLKGAADYNKNGIVTITELFNFVSTNVKNYTAGAQSPQISGDYDKNMPVGFAKNNN